MIETTRPRLAEEAPAPPPVRRVLFLPLETWPRILMPLVIGILSLSAWEIAVRVNEVPHYVLPPPSVIWQTLLRDWHSLSVSLGITLQITFAALAVAAVLGLALAVLFAQSKWIELAFYPIAVVLQVTPIIAIAPLMVLMLVTGIFPNWILPIINDSVTRLMSGLIG